jgi:hypothetical protein
MFRNSLGKNGGKSRACHSFPCAFLEGTSFSNVTEKESEVCSIYDAFLIRSRRLWKTTTTIFPPFFSGEGMLRNNGGAPLTRGGPWQEAYKDAMLERDQGRLLKKIEDAHAAIQRRIEELKLGSDHDGSSGERQAIADALHSLRTIQELASRSFAEGSRKGGKTPEDGETS